MCQVAIARRAELLLTERAQSGNHRLLCLFGHGAGGWSKILGTWLHPFGHFRPISSSVKSYMAQIVNHPLANIDCFWIALGLRTNDLKLAVFCQLAPIPPNIENL